MAVGAVSALVAVLLVAPPATAGVTVTPDVGNLRAGARPQLPYVNWSTQRIVDGSRRISISGIKARVITLHKVDGGYLLGRELATGNDLVFVRTDGARRVLVRNWMPPRRWQLYPGLAVSRDGDRVVVNTATFEARTPTYVDTRVLNLPSGTLVRRRDFGVDRPGLLGFGVDRVLLSSNPDTQWWTPASDALTLLRAFAGGQSADLSAWQWAVRPDVGVYSVQGIPPDTEPDWPVSEEDWIIGPWSPDDAMVAANNEVVDGTDEASAYMVLRASDGADLLTVLGAQHPQITWETNSSLLLRTRNDTGAYQLIRCTLAGSCERVGPSTTSRHGVIIPATRRNS